MDSAPQSSRDCRSPDPLHHISCSVFILLVCSWPIRATVMDREAWRAAAHGVAKSRTQLSWLMPQLMTTFPHLPATLMTLWRMWQKQKSPSVPPGVSLREREAFSSLPASCCLKPSWAMNMMPTHWERHREPGLQTEARYQPGPCNSGPPKTKPDWHNDLNLEV